MPDDAADPSTRATLLDSACPLAAWPCVFTVILQGSTVRMFPTPSGDGGGKVDATILKIHEPKVVVPEAALPCEVMANVGDAESVVNTRVVVAVVPNEGTPAGKVNGACRTAAATDGDALKLASVAATGTGMG